MAHLSWTDLESRFRALQSSLQPHSWIRLDYQYGGASESWSMIAFGSLAAEAEFKTLCAIAGDLLFTLPTTAVAPEALSETGANRRWYLALWHHMTRRVPDHKAFAGPDDKVGMIFTGRINQPVQLSATLCLQFSTIVPPDLPASWSGRALRGIAHEAHERGPFWALIGFLVTVALGLLAL